MSVLPSFKSAFSSLAEIESTGNIQIADDSGLIARPSNRPTPSNSTLAPQSALQDHFPPRTSAPNFTSWSHVPTASKEKPRDPHHFPTSTSRHQNPSLSSRPTIPLLPLDLLSPDTPSFYVDDRRDKRPTPNSTPTRKFIEPLPLENLGLGTDSYLGVRPDSFKRSRSPSVHAGTYKRPRSQSVSAGAYLKVHSNSSSERHPTHHSASDRRDPTVMATRKSALPEAVPYPTSRPNGRPVPTSRGEARSLRQVSPAALTLVTPSRKMGRAANSALALRKPSTISQEQSDAGTQMSRGERTGNAGACGSGTGGIGGQESLKIGGSGAGSGEDRISPGPVSVGPDNDLTNSSALGGGGTRPMNLVTFAPPSFSHRSAGSRPRVHSYNNRILSDDILEDSTSRVAVDVLSSPRQQSDNSTGTMRRLRCLGPSLASLRGPTASDLSHLIGESREGASQKKSGTAEASLSGPEIVAADRDKNGAEDSQRDKEIVDDRSASPTAPFGTEGPTHKRAESLSVGRDISAEGRGVELGGNGTGTYQVNGRAYGGNDSSLWRVDGNGFDQNKVSPRNREGRGYEAWRQVPIPEGLKANEISGEMRKHDRDVQTGIGSAVAGTGDFNGRAGQTGEMKGEYWSDQMRQRNTADRGKSSGNVDQRVRNAKRVEGQGERNGDDGESVQCPHCPKRLRNTVTLQNHVRVVHDHSGDYRCGQCGVTFMWRSTLGNHVRLVHEKQRPYKCKDCAKAFRWKSHLREHYSVTHRGEKPFKCETCGKTFGRKNNMQKHVRKHKENTS